MAEQMLAFLLRGVNIGKHKRVAMADLRALAADLGFADARTYVASGNLIARTSMKPADAAILLESAIAEHLGVGTAVIVRTPNGLRDALAAAPVDAPADTHCYVCYLDKKPAAKDVDSLLARDFGKDSLIIIGSNAYLTFSDTPHKSSLSNAVLERVLNVRSTARNLRTAKALVDLTSERVGRVGLEPTTTRL